jgi:hypothetical protein
VTVGDWLASRGHDGSYARWNGWHWALETARIGGAVAALRVLWDAYARGHNGETCQRCGRAYLLWWADDALYATVTGYTPRVGDLMGGLFCLACFDRMAERKGIILSWKPLLLSDRGDTEKGGTQ